MTNVPFTTESLPAFIAGVILSVAAETILIVPCVVLANSGNSILSAGGMKRTGAVISACYFIFLAFVGGDCVRDFISFSENAFGGDMNAAMATVVVLAVGIYGAYSGFSGIMRASSVLAFLAVGALITTALSAADYFDVGNFRVFDSLRAGGVISSAVMDISSGGELVLLALLLLRSENPRRCGYGFLAVELIVTEAVTCLIIAALGGYALVTDYPFFTLGNLGNALHLEGVFFVLWCSCALVKLSLVIFVMGDILSSVFVHAGKKYLICGISAGLSGELLLLSDASVGAAGALPTVILAAVVPLVVLLISGRREQVCHTEKR